MIAVIGIELIGDDHRHRASTGRWTDGKIGHSLTRALKEQARYEAKPKAWVAMIVGLDPKYAVIREFMRGKRDYAEASGTGARGVYRWFELPEGEIYEISAPQSWKHADRYFALSTRGTLLRMELDEVIEWFLRRIM